MSDENVLWHWSQVLGKVFANYLFVCQVEQERGGQVRPRRVDAFHLLRKANGEQDEHGSQCENQKLKRQNKRIFLGTAIRNFGVH